MAEMTMLQRHPLSHWLAFAAFLGTTVQLVAQTPHVSPDSVVQSPECDRAVLSLGGPWHLVVQRADQPNTGRFETSVTFIPESVSTLRLRLSHGNPGFCLGGTVPADWAGVIPLHFRPPIMRLWRPASSPDSVVAQVGPYSTSMVLWDAMRLRGQLVADTVRGQWEWLNGTADTLRGTFMMFRPNTSSPPSNQRMDQSVRGRRLSQNWHDQTVAGRLP